MSAPGIAPYFLQSDRLGLRCWQPGDRSLAVRLWADPEVSRFIVLMPPTAEEAWVRLQREIATQAAHGFQYWPLFVRDGGRFIGCCGLRPRPAEPDVPEFGVHLLSACWRRGYASEAASMVFAHAFGHLGCRGLFAGHNPRNEASRGLLLRLGFTHTHDEFYPPTGLMHPSYRLAAPSGAVEGNCS